jgi:hypothetical protein
MLLTQSFLHAQNNDGLTAHWKLDEEKGKITVDEVTK